MEGKDYCTLVTCTPYAINTHRLLVRGERTEYIPPEELAEQNPDHFAVRQYAKYKLAAGKTAKSILVSCGARLAPFDIKELRDLTSL